MNRRDFLRTTGLGATIVGAGAAAYDVLAASASLAEQRTLEALDRQRPAAGFRWFSAPEAAAAGALADTIIPPEPGSAGAREAGVVARLDVRLAETPAERSLFSRGLISFDYAARDQWGRSCGDLSPRQLQALLGEIDAAYQRKRADEQLWDRADSRLGVLENHWHGIEPAVDLFPRLVRWVKEAYYTSPAAWQWLGYDGPPFPGGYLGRPGGCPGGLPAAAPPAGPLA